MKIDRMTKILLCLITACLILIAARPYIAPSSVRADSSAYPLFVEPGTSMLRAPDGSRQVMGKIVIDLRNGNVWGFPTLQQEPYPAAGAKTTPQTSHPFLLGKFSLSDIDRSGGGGDE